MKDQRGGMEQGAVQELMSQAAGPPSKSWAWDPGVWEESRDGSVALGSPDHVPNLSVKFHQLDRDFCQVLFWAHESESSRLTQGLMSEIDVE